MTDSVEVKKTRTRAVVTYHLMSFDIDKAGYLSDIKDLPFPAAITPEKRGHVEIVKKAVMDALSAGKTEYAGKNLAVVSFRKSAMFKVRMIQKEPEAMCEDVKIY